MAAPTTALSIEARRAAWNELWRRLLAPAPSDDSTPEEPRDEEESDDEAA